MKPLERFLITCSDNSIIELFEAAYKEIDKRNLWKEENES